ncbi:MAG: FISUMP domain-containing protein [Myxococcales bacterium]
MISHRVTALLCTLPLLGGCFLFPAETHDPKCSITSPDPGGTAVFEPGSTVNVAFDVTDEDGDVSSVAIDIGDGLVKQALEARTGSFQYPWDSTGQTGLSYALRISVADATGGTANCYSSIRLNIPLTPKVTTSPVSKLTPYFAETGGDVTDQGKGTFWGQGVVWGKSPAPTVQTATKLADDSKKSPYTSALKDLEPSTTYYLRAYAENSNGMAYGEEVSFTTPAPVFGDEGTVADADGNSYKAVRIGTQVWMAESLRTKHYRDNTAIPDGTGKGQYANAPYWFAFDDNPTNVADYGLLYTGQAARNALLCPLGWHVPTWDEVLTLWYYLGGDAAGGRMKEAGTAHWEDPNKDATNESGFSARGNGWRTPVSFYDLRHNAFFWSATQSTTALQQYCYQLNTTHGGFIPGSDPEEHGYAVRCLKD